MATQLFWETARTINYSYYIFLRYSAPIQINPDTRSYQIEKRHMKNVPFYIALFFNVALISSFLDVSVEIVIGSLHKPAHVFVVNFVGFCTGILNLVLLAFILQSRDLSWTTYMNQTIEMDIKLSHGTKISKLSAQPTSGYVNLLTTGNIELCNILLILHFEN